jgi:hypothetical protein
MNVAFVLCVPALAGDGGDAADVAGSHLVDAAPAPVAADRSPPPQQIGGVLLGAPFDRAGFTCDESGSVCERLHRWGVLEGDLRVDTCGDIAQRVGFHVMFTKDSRRARRHLAGSRSSHAVPDPELRAIEAVAVFLSPVSEWAMQPPEYGESEGASVKLTELVSPQGQRRVIMSSLGRGRAWFGKSWVVGTWAEADTPCPSGATAEAAAGP